MKQPIALRIEAGPLAAARRCASEENRTFTNPIKTGLKARIAGGPGRPASPFARETEAAAARGAVPVPSGGRL